MNKLQKIGFSGLAFAVGAEQSFAAAATSGISFGTAKVDPTLQ
jgi:hypothetical protein